MVLYKTTERSVIERIRQRQQPVNDKVVQGMGDDCAVWCHQHHNLELITIDTLVESSHFDLSYHPPGLLGRKAAAVNISDIAAMGGVPRFALLSLALPPAIADNWLDAFLAGFYDMLAEHNVTLIGGDTVKSDQQAMFSVTLIGEVAEHVVLYRSNAQVGDQVWVSGFLGESGAGLALCRQNISVPAQWQRKLIKAHLDPMPQVTLGQVLAESRLVHAMIDISDGLATDFAHICKESKVGGEIIAADLPISDELLQAATFYQQSPDGWLLQGGEDYQLLFTCAAADGVYLQQLVKAQCGVDICCVGRIVAGSGVTLVKNGQGHDITFHGFDHFSAHLDKTQV